MVSEKTKNNLLSPTLDVVFQALFGEQGSERITKDFLQTILLEEITEIDLSKNPMLRRDMPNDKLGVLDVFVKINGKENCDLEMQMVVQEDIIERILYYWSKMYIRNIKKGDEYSNLEKTIVILITDKKIKNLEELDYHTKWQILDTKTCRKILTDKLEIHIIELEKIKESNITEKDKLLDWLEFLINPDSERMVKVMQENEAIKEAKDKLDKISEDGKMQQLAWWREKAIYEENSLKSQARAKGEKIGMEKGSKNAKLEIAKKMRLKNIPIAEIIEFTELSKEEIENL